MLLFFLQLWKMAGRVPVRGRNGTFQSFWLHVAEEQQGIMGWVVFLHIRVHAACFSEHYTSHNTVEFLHSVVHLSTFPYLHLSITTMRNVLDGADWKLPGKHLNFWQHWPEFWPGEFLANSGTCSQNDGKHQEQHGGPIWISAIIKHRGQLIKTNKGSWFQKGLQAGWGGKNTICLISLVELYTTKSNLVF